MDMPVDKVGCPVDRTSLRSPFRGAGGCPCPPAEKRECPPAEDGSIRLRHVPRDAAEPDGLVRKRTTMTDADTKPESHLLTIPRMLGKSYAKVADTPPDASTPAPGHSNGSLLRECSTRGA